MKHALILLFSLLTLPVAASDYEADRSGYWANAVRPLKQHCLKCHGPDQAKGEFRVDKDLPNNFQDHSANEKWQEVLDVLNAGEMPPKDQPRPDAALTTRMTEWIERELDRAEESRSGSRVVLRRLNRAEYDNTIRDLVGVPLEVPLSHKFGFPEDPTTRGFDNVGDTLMMSTMQMELYLEAARYVIDRAIVEGPRPPSVKWRVQLSQHEPNRFIPMKPWVEGTKKTVCVRPGHYQPSDVDSLKKDEWLELRTTSELAGFDFIENPLDGPFVVRARLATKIPSREEVAERLIANYETYAAGKPSYTDERITEKKEALRKAALEDFRFDYRAGRGIFMLSERGQPRNVARFDVTAGTDEGEVKEFPVWLDAGRVGIKISNDYFKADGGIPTHGTNFRDLKSRAPMPYLYVDWMEFEGPIFPEWPPSYHNRILFDSPLKDTDATAYAREVLSRFMQRAYRRPVSDEEVDAKLAIYKRMRPEHESFEQAIKEPLIAVLASPNFLFIAEPNANTAGSSATVAKQTAALNDYQIASRLSYFLWSSMPDETLFGLASSGDIRNADVLKSQVDRMLKDSRSAAFVKNFAGQWLKLRNIGKNPPGELLFPHYDPHMESSMRAETEAFFAEILHKELDARNFLDSDWVMINARLAKFYGINGVKGDEIRRVALPADHPRGGLLTQASVLCVTSNGTRTSPVVRGVWILENILNDPPPPPPPNVEEVAQPAPGKSTATQRERLAKHREVESCARCHQKIDPLGFSLEHFDGSGYWREIEASGRHGSIHRNDPKIDATAQLPGGNEFYGSDGLKAELLKREDQFLEMLATKMTVYALGRDVTRSDRDSIRAAAAEMKKNGRTLKSLINYIVTSPAFTVK